MTYSWKPTEDYLTTTNVARLIRRFGCADIGELRARSTADIGAFWGGVVDDLDIPFARPFNQVVDITAGIERPEWFIDGGINAAGASLGRWAVQTPDIDAVVHESEDGTVTTTTFGDLEDQVARVRAGLADRGIGPGDAVAILLPMTTEAVVATHAVASLGAMLVPLFSGFAATAIAARLQDADVKAVITADGTLRRGKTVDMRKQLDAALPSCPTVELVVVVDNVGADLTLGVHEVAWSTLLETDAPVEYADTNASDVLLLGYTSGSSGRPKGAVHTHGGFLVRTASEVAYGFDLNAGDRFSWVTDMGWVMGPLSIFGTHAVGGTLALYEGSPDTPDTNRIWNFVQTHRIATLGVSPTLIRALKSDELPTADLSSLRTIGSTGEPWDPDSYDWLARDVLGGRIPIINFSGGTEVGGSFLCPYPVEEIASCSLGGPALGMDVDVVDDAGQPLRGAIGELVCRQPWPSMTRSVWRDDDRYLETYWSTFPGIWRHGDFALVEDGSWYILGRSDDVMNVAGKRIAPAEIESVVTTDPDVAEAAVVGMPDQTKGEAVWVFWIGRPGADETDVAARVKKLVADEVGKPFAPSRLVKVDQLPKTRSAKILRRAIRAAAMGTDPGDMSSAENPEAVDHIRALTSTATVS